MSIKIKDSSLILVLLLFATTQILGQTESPSNILINKLDMSNGISSSISDIYLDSKENLWIAQVNQAVIKFNGNLIEKKPVLINNTSFSSVSHFITTRENELKFAVDQNTLLLQLNKNDTLTAYKDLLKEESILINRYLLDKNILSEIQNAHPDKTLTISKILELGKNFNLIVAEYGTYIYLYNDSVYLHKSNRCINITHLILNKYELYNIFYYQGNLFQFNKNKFYHIDISTNKISKLDIDNSVAAIIDSTYKKHKKFPFVRFFSSPNLFTLNLEYLFEITSFAKGILSIKLVSPLNFIKSQITQVIKNPRDGNFFISTYFDGIFVLKTNQFYYPFNKDFLEASKIKVFYPITTTADNSIFSEWGVINPKTGYSKVLNMNAPGEYAIMMGPDHTYWASHDTNKILHFDSEYKVLKKYNYIRSKRHIYHLTVNENNDILLINGNTIGKYSKDSFVVVKDFTKLIPYDLIFNKIVPIGNETYVLCSNKGLYTYYSKNDKLIKEPIFENTYILDATPTKKNNDYIVQGYNSNAIYYKYNGAFYKIPVPKNTGLQNIASLLIDNNEKIWITTDNGLYVTILAELNEYCEKKSNSVFFYSYNLKDGLPSTEFNGGLRESAVLTNDGFIGLCSLKGLVLFLENSVNQVFPVNKVIINSIKIKDTLQEVADTITGKGLSSNIHFTVTTAYFGNPSNILIEYSIGNALNKEWKPITNNEFNISGLKIGTTQIFIRLKTGFGSKSYNYTTVTVINQPYFYQSTTFIVIICIATLSLFLFFLNTLRKSAIRKRIINLSKEKISAQNIQLEKKTQLLESTVNQLEAAIEEVNDSKLKLNESIQLKEKLISLIIHDLKSPLYSQSIILNQLLSTNQTQNNNLSPIIADLKASNNAILNFTKDFLLWYSLQENGFTIKQSSFHLASLIAEIGNLYSEISKQKNIPIVNKIHTELNIVCDRTLLEIILRNIIDNALKYTENGHIEISTIQDIDRITIIVKDTGIGINNDTLAIINTPNNEKELSSFGYRFIQTLSMKINAQIDIQPHYPNGTVVKISLPITPENING